jgi:hypothetical protein
MHSVCSLVCVYYCSTVYKTVRVGVFYCSTYCKAVREGDSGGHVLRETTSRGLCGIVCLSRTSDGTREEPVTLTQCGAGVPTLSVT